MERLQRKMLQKCVGTTNGRSLAPRCLSVETTDWALAEMGGRAWADG